MSRRPSPIALVKSYFDSGPGAESAELLSQVAHNQAQEPIHANRTPVGVASLVEKQAIDQLSNRSGNQADRQAINQTDRQTVEPSNSQSFRQYGNQYSQQPIEHATGQSFGQSIKQANEQTHKHPANNNPRHIWLPLNENQGRILLFLYESGAGLTNMDIVCNETGVAYGTARAAIDTLVREGYITHKTRHNGHAFRGFEYAMNSHLCTLYVNRVRGDDQGQTTWQSIKQSTKQLGKQPNSPPLSSSSSKEEKSTTAENREGQDVLRDPELGYWRDKGVNSRQIEKWCDEFEMELDLVIQSLKYCRYEMVVLNYEEEKQINNPLNWFYKVMQRSGLYPKPAGYKSLTELRVEQMEEAAKEAEELRQRQQKAEKSIELQRIMSDPNSHEYQSLRGQTSEFARASGGKTLEMEMEAIFMGTLSCTTTP